MLERTLLIGVNLSPFVSYFDFQLESLSSNLATIDPQMDFSLNFAPGGRPIYDDGRESTPQPKIPASK